MLSDELKQLRDRFPMPEGEEPKKPEGEMPLWNGFERGEKHAAWFKDVYRVWTRAMDAYQEWNLAERLHMVADALVTLAQEVAVLEAEGKLVPEKTLLLFLGADYLRENGKPKGLFGSLFG